MRNILILLAAGFIMFACQSKESSNSESQEIPVNETGLVESQDVHFYGDKIDAEGAVAMDEMVKQVQETGSFTGKVEGEITSTCAKKGCWMTMKKMGAEELRVRFKDYGFFVPTEGQEGKTAIMQGVAKLDTISVDLRRHYAEDAGKSKEEIEAITEPSYDVSFLASGVIIK